VVGVLLLLLAGVGGTVAYYGPSTVESWLGDKPDADVVATQRDKAEEHNFAGEEAYRKGEAAEKAKKKQEARAKYKAAIASFRRALAVDDTFAKAHRNLGIALAKSNKQAEAVQQYRTYLRKEPNAPDRKAVLKIINDWEASQEKKKRR
jgi:tetratricopeptide (TPR) repeat protein